MLNHSHTYLVKILDKIDGVNIPLLKYTLSPSLMDPGLIRIRKPHKREEQVPLEITGKEQGLELVDDSLFDNEFAMDLVFSEMKQESKKEQTVELSATQIMDQIHILFWLYRMTSFAQSKGLWYVFLYCFYSNNL